MKLIHTFFAIVIATLFSSALRAQTEQIDTYAPSYVAPYIGIVTDLHIGQMTETEDGEEEKHDMMGLKMMEASFSTDKTLPASAYIVLEMPGEDIEVSEAAIRLKELLPNDYEIIAGRKLVDFGKWNTRHQHDTPFAGGFMLYSNVHEGQFVGNGAELHKYTFVGDVPLRWSVGAWSDIEAHGHGGHGHGHSEEEEEEEEEYAFSDTQFSARITAQHDMGANGWWQWGFSSLQGYATAFDLHFNSKSLTDKSSWLSGLESWRVEGEMNTSVFIHHMFNESWGMGVQAGRYKPEEHPEDYFMAVGAQISRHWGEASRLRLGVMQASSEAEDEEHDITSVMLDYTHFFGLHRHGMDW